MQRGKGRYLVQAADLRDQMVEWLQEHVAAAGARGAVVGLSGGLDSAVVAALCKIAFPNDTVGIILPIESDPIDATYSNLLAERLDLRVLTADLTEVWQSMLASIEGALGPAPGPSLNISRANVKPRLRMSSLYYVAQRLNYLVVGTENLPELVVGYSTKYGDAGVDLMPLANLLKREVWDLARILNVPQEIIDRPPTAGLWAGQTDENEMGLTYEQLDQYLLTGEGPANVAETIERMRRRSEHKRHMPPHGPTPVR